MEFGYFLNAFGTKVTMVEILPKVLPVEDDDQALLAANDTRYGLAASVWTRDEGVAIALGERVETGTWFMNRCDYLDPALAWTGVKDSGAMNDRLDAAPRSGRVPAPLGLLHLRHLARHHC